MYQRLHGDAIETYKCYHGIYQIDKSFLPLNQSNIAVITRGHYLMKETVKRSITANFLSYHIVNFLCLNMWRLLTWSIVTKNVLSDKFCSHLRLSTDVADF